MSKHTCCAQVRVSGLALYRSRACGITAKFEHDGKHYCGTHYPPNVKARQDKSMEDYRQKIAFQNKIREAPFVEIKRLTEQCNELLAELKSIANANPRNWDAPHNDTASFQQWVQSRARAAISKAEGKA